MKGIYPTNDIIRACFIHILTLEEEEKNRITSGGKLPVVLLHVMCVQFEIYVYMYM